MTGYNCSVFVYGATGAGKTFTTLRKNVMKSNMPKEFNMEKTTKLQDEVERLQEVIKNLESKLATATAKPPATSKAYDESELQCWYRKIDAVYSSVVKAQKDSYETQSKVKILKCRCRRNEKREKYKKILTLDLDPNQEDTTRFRASIDRFGKQIDRQRENLAGWRKELQKSQKDLEMLSKEVSEAQCSNILQVYLTKKDMEVQTLKKNIETNHKDEMMSVLYAENEHLRQMLSLGCEILQRDYLIMKSDSEHKEKLEKLRKLMNGFEIKFKDEENKDSEDEFQLDSEDSHPELANGVEIQINGKRKKDSSDDESSVVHLKRNKKLFDEYVDLGD